MRAQAPLCSNRSNEALQSVSRVRALAKQLEEPVSGLVCHSARAAVEVQVGQARCLVVHVARHAEEALLGLRRLPPCSHLRLAALAEVERRAEQSVVRCIRLVVHFVLALDSMPVESLCTGLEHALENVSDDVVDILSECLIE